MAEDAGLTGMAFSTVKVAPRPPKPRDAGLTIVADRGVGLNRVADLLETISPQDTVAVTQAKTSTPPVDGELTRTGSTWTLTVTGPPNSECVAVDGGGNARIVRLDATGRC